MRQTFRQTRTPSMCCPLVLERKSIKQVFKNDNVLKCNDERTFFDVYGAIMGRFLGTFWCEIRVSTIVVRFRLYSG